MPILFVILNETRGAYLPSVVTSEGRACRRHVHSSHTSSVWRDRLASVNCGIILAPLDPVNQRSTWETTAGDIVRARRSVIINVNAAPCFAVQGLRDHCNSVWTNPGRLQINCILRVALRVERQLERNVLRKSGQLESLYCVIIIQTNPEIGRIRR